MSPEIREIIDNDKFYLGSVRAIAERLPESDAELDDWITQAIDDHDQMALHFLLAAAAMQGRPVDARHLRRGFCMMSNADMTLCLIWKMQGDVPDAILHAFQGTLMSHPMHALGLLTIYAWCAKHRDGVCPPEIIPEARLLAHAAHNVPQQIAYLWGLADRLQDPHFSAVLAGCFKGHNIDQVKKAGIDLSNATLALADAPITLFLAKEADRRIGTRGPLRRAVERIGRNDPCPCGSGKKYKRCCEDKDVERLRHSSTVPGRTQAEVKARPEEGLTAARLETMLGHDLARIDPARVKESLLQPYLMRLSGFGLFSEIVATFEIHGCHTETMCKLWDFCLFFIMRKHAIEPARRLYHLRCQHGPFNGALKASYRLLLCGDDPPRYLVMLEHLCHHALRTGDTDCQTELACGLLHSPFKALGILISHSAIPVGTTKDASFLLDEIQIARDHLNLSPDEPFTDILEARLQDTSRETGSETAAHEKARRELAHLAAQTRAQNEKLAQIQRDIRLHQKRLDTATAAHTPPPAADTDALRQLQAKLAATSAALRASNEERAVLRRKTIDDLARSDARRASRPAEPPADDSDPDDTTHPPWRHRQPAAPSSPRLPPPLLRHPPAPAHPGWPRRPHPPRPHRRRRSHCLHRHPPPPRRRGRPPRPHRPRPPPPLPPPPPPRRSRRPHQPPRPRPPH